MKKIILALMLIFVFNGCNEATKLAWQTTLNKSKLYSDYDYYLKEANADEIAKYLGNKKNLVGLSRENNDRSLLLKLKNRMLVLYRKEHTYESYLKAFKYSKSTQDIKQAYALASNDMEKLNAEKTMVEVIPEKVFTILDGQDGASNVQTKGGNLLNISGASISGKDFSKNYSLKSDFLQYGSYRVKVKYNFDAVYRVKQIMGRSNQSLHKDITVVYSLNTGNGYKDTKNVTFKGVIVDIQAGAFGIKTYSAKMKSNRLTYDIVGVEN